MFFVMWLTVLILPFVITYVILSPLVLPKNVYKLTSVPYVL
jgi:hypothetical protein